MTINETSLPMLLWLILAHVSTGVFSTLAACLAIGYGLYGIYSLWSNRK
jgi:hypothetical protein